MLPYVPGDSCPPMFSSASRVDKSARVILFALLWMRVFEILISYKTFSKYLCPKCCECKQKSFGTVKKCTLSRFFFQATRMNQMKYFSVCTSDFLHLVKITLNLVFFLVFSNFLQNNKLDDIESKRKIT